MNKKLQAGKRSRGFEGESSKKYEKGFLGNMRIKDLDDKYQTLIANIAALRKSNSVIYNKVLNKLGTLNKHCGNSTYLLYMCVFVLCISVFFVCIYVSGVVYANVNL